MPFRSFACLFLVSCLSLPSPGLHAEPADDPLRTITIHIENDSTRPGSDSYYTSGERISYVSPTGAVPAPLAALGHALLGEGKKRLGLDLSQNIYTPRHTQEVNPPLNDRPYAAVLLGAVTLIQDTDTSRTALSLGLGVIGPAALGRAVQNGFHDLIHQPQARGWSTQISNQPVVQLYAERTWRLPLGAIATPLGGVEADVLPNVTLAAGTFRVHAQTGAQVRIGQGLNADFGAPRIRPGPTGTDAYTPDRPFAWYVFAGVDGQVVAWDETLDGLPFARSRRVKREPVVGEAQFGFAIIAGNMRLTLMQVLQSSAFRDQTNGLFQYSGAALSVKF